MSVYTRPKPQEEPIFSTSSLTQQASPGLIFRKWQVWDKFDEKDKFKRDKSRLEYLQMVGRAVQSAYTNGYSSWHSHHYEPAMDALKAEKPVYRTMWRLLVGWGDNPTMEAGLTLHHLYGIPCIPGSAVKGVLHHVAELETMEGVNPKASEFAENSLLSLDAEPAAWLNSLADKLLLVRAIFGSLHLEQGTLERSGRKIPTGPECPKQLLEALKKKIERQAEAKKIQLSKLPGKWNTLYQLLQYLLDNTAGGLVSFYDAVPLPGQEGLLQADIVNSHYSDYYGDGKNPPSDDQQPIPVTFLAVRPGVKFQFPFRIARWPAATGRDEEEKQLLIALQGKKRDEIIAMVNDWLKKALGQWGIGAKTAAGYGYFDTGIIPTPTLKGETTGKTELQKMELKEVEQQISSIQPPPFQSSIKPAAKIKGISRQHNQELWQRLSKNDYLEKIEGGAVSGKASSQTLPWRKISRGGKRLEILYQCGRYYCPVTLTLQGIDSQEQAQYIWEEIILPELNTLERESY